MKREEKKKEKRTTISESELLKHPKRMTKHYLPIKVKQIFDPHDDGCISLTNNLRSLNKRNDMK